MIKIREDFKDLIPALTPEEFAQLEANCIADGIREPIMLYWAGEVVDDEAEEKETIDYIIDGHNRYAIAEKHKLEYQVEWLQFDSDDEVKEWMIKNQFGRRNLSNYQRSILALALEDLYKTKAKEKEYLRKTTLEKSTKSNLPTIDTRKEISNIANVSDNTIAKVKVIEAKAAPEIKQKLSTGEVSINQVYQEIKKEEKKAERIENITKQIEDINAGKLPELKGLFEIVSVDPPWPYEDKTKEITSYDPNGRRVANPYPEMSIEEIKKIKLPLANDSIVFLWTTHKFLPESFNILKEWNLDYKATIVWNKDKLGMGSWFRMQCEICLISIKGKPYFENTKYADIICEKRREHSRKPDIFFEIVNDITIGRKLEYFAREKREGWEIFGNDINKF